MNRLLFAFLLLLSAGTADAALYVDIKGQSGSSVVTMTVWGSGTWGWTEYDDVIRYDNIEGGFAGDAFNNHGSLVNPEDDDWIDIDGFTVNTVGFFGQAQSFQFKRLLIESDDYFHVELDDFLFGTTGDAFWTFRGKEWSIDKTSFLVDLAELGGSFDDLGLGTFIDTPDLNGHGTGQLTLTVSAVPVPAAVWLFGSGLLGLVGYSKRKRANA